MLDSEISESSNSGALEVGLEGLSEGEILSVPEVDNVLGGSMEHSLSVSNRQLLGVVQRRIEEYCESLFTDLNFDRRIASAAEHSYIEAVSQAEKGELTNRELRLNAILIGKFRKRVTEQALRLQGILAFLNGSIVGEERRREDKLDQTLEKMERLERESAALEATRAAEAAAAEASAAAAAASEGPPLELSIRVNGGIEDDELLKALRLLQESGIGLSSGVLKSVGEGDGEGELEVEDG